MAEKKDEDRARRAEIKKAHRERRKLLDPFICRGRVGPKKGAKPSFCWRLKTERSPGTPTTHRIQFVSRVTGRPIGFMGRGCTISDFPEFAQTFDVLNKHLAEDTAEQCIRMAREKRFFFPEDRLQAKTLLRILEMRAKHR